MKQLTSQDLIDAQRDAVTHIHSVANSTLAAIESLTSLNLQVMCEAIETAGNHGQALLNAKTPHEAAAIHMNALNPVALSAISYFRSVHNIANGFSTEVGDLHEEKIEQLNKAAEEAALKASQNNPLGSAVTLAVVKQTIEVANSALAHFNRANQSASEFRAAHIDTAHAAVAKACKTPS
jgi:phasin family protein